MRNVRKGIKENVGRRIGRDVSSTKTLQYCETDLMCKYLRRVVLQTKAFLTRAFVTAKAVGAFEVKSTNILPFGAFIDFYTYGKRKEVKLRRKKKKKKKKIQYTKTSFDKPSHFPSFKRKPLPLQIHL